MHRAVADEAVALHLECSDRPHSFPLSARFAAVRARARQHILWDAYFAQAATKEERDALMAKYKVTVQDADFFNGPATQ